MNIWNIVSLLLNKLSAKACFIKILKNQQLLEEGIYVFSFTNKIVLRSKNVDIKVTDYKDFTFTTKIINFFPLIIKRNEISLFKGQIMMMTSNQTIKVFDLRQNKILTVLEEKEKERIINNYYCLEKYLPITAMKHENNSIGLVDRYISTIDIRNSSEDIQRSVYLRIIDDQIRVVMGSKKTKMKDSKEEIDSVKGQLDYYTGGILQDLFERTIYIRKMPCFFLHCDIHFENVLLESKTEDIYYIDFEYARDEIAIYDVCNCAFVEFANGHNSYLIDKLLDKESDFGRKFNLLINQAEIPLYGDSVIYIYRYLISRIVFDVMHLRETNDENTYKVRIQKMNTDYNRFIEHIKRR